MRLTHQEDKEHILGSVLWAANLQHQVGDEHAQHE